MKAFHRSQSGMALPMVLWTIALIGGMTILLAGIIQGWITEETRQGKQFIARQQALSGVALGMNPLVGPGDPLLDHHAHDAGEGYQVVIKDESGLINPNTLLGAVPDRRDLIKRLFTSWGIDINACDAAADGLYDWQSASLLRSLHGAKKPEYDAIGRQGFPPNAPFDSVSEMALVLGFDPVMQAHPTWRNTFTTYYNGKINILHTPKEILTDFLGLTSTQADQWIALRSGKDGIDGSTDDLVVDTIDHAVSLIGCNGVQRNMILETCDVQGSVRRIESTGECNGVKHRITVILAGGATDNAQSHGNLLGWSEQ